MSATPVSASASSVTAARFEIQVTRHLGVDGALIGDPPGIARDPRALIPLYRAMTRTRVFDEKAVALQRTGRLGTFAASLGQEAVGVGAASAMRDEDVLVPSFREQSAQLWRGVTLKELLRFWGGDERGGDFAGPREDFPIAIPVASQLPHAVGVALAFQLRGEPRVAVSFCGDGATSKGDFYEAINIAGVWAAPTVFIVVNNQWAISVSRAMQSAAETLAQKAIAAGVPGEQVDGCDVIAVREVVSRALERARRGDGPTLIEALTYRLCDHTTADDARRYRDDAEVSRRWKEEPIARLRAFLVASEVWSTEDERALRTELDAEIAAAVADYVAEPPQPATAMFDFTFARLPAELAAQRALLAADEEESEPERSASGKSASGSLASGTLASGTRGPKEHDDA